jgi:hypothetical protein
LEDCLTPLDALSYLSKRSWFAMEKGSEIKSENARNVILSYGDQVYFVNRVNVCLGEGEVKYKAVFHAKRVTDNQLQDLELEIDKKLYDMLVEYTKLDNFDLVLILQIEGKESKMCLMSQNWLKQQMAKKPDKYVI